MRQADMSSAAAFGYLGPQVNLWPDRPPWIEHIAHLQQDQFSHADAREHCNRWRMPFGALSGGMVG